MIQSSALGSADRAPLNDLKRSLLAILSLYKSEFAGPIFVEELLKPMIEILFRDLADVAEVVNKFLFLEPLQPIFLILKVTSTDFLFVDYN